MRAISRKLSYGGENVPIFSYKYRFAELPLFDLVSRGTKTIRVGAHSLSERAQRTEILRTGDRMLAMLLLFTPQRMEWSLTDLARELKVSKSMAARMLSTLRARGFVVQDPYTRHFRLGFGVLELSQAVEVESGLRRAAHPSVQTLAAETGESIFLTVTDGDEVVTLDQVVPDHPLKFSSAGRRWSPLHCGAANRVLLAYLHDEVQEEYLSRPLERCTDQSIVDAPRLKELLAEIRYRGYAISHGELTPGVTGVAVPIWSRASTVVGALCVAGPDIRVDPSQFPTMIQRLKAAAEEIKQRL